jgi:flagellar hook-length control protein FliK
LRTSATPHDESGIVTSKVSAAEAKGEGGVGAVAPAQASAASAAPATPLPTAGVGMQDMIDAIRATIEIAARQGSTQARIALEPAELGQIRIHLSQTTDGLLARVTADTPAAAQALANGRSELHQSLSSLGLSLRLDIGTFGQSEARDRGERSAKRTGGSADGSSRAAAEAEGAQALAQIEDPHAPAGLAAGRLVDVLA